MGGSGDDTINGGTGNDKIWSGSGDDTVHGGIGNDEIDAGTGLDTLYADEGTVHKFTLEDGGDTIYSGEGQNFFYFRGATTNGATTIDNLHPDDQLKFKNNLTGPWKVSMNDGTNIKICKADVCIGTNHD